MQSSGSAFEAILDRHFETHLDENPVAATYAGLRHGEGRLGETGLAFEQRQEKLRQSTLRALDQLSPAGLSAEQHLDRLALRSRLLREAEDFARGRHHLEPGAIDLLLNLLLHELQRGDDEPARAAKNIRSILAQAPAFLSSAATLVTQPEPVWLRIMQQTAAGAPTLLKAVETFLQPSALPADARALAATARAVERYASHAADRRPAAPGSFAIGSDWLQRRVRDELGLDYTLGQIERLAEGEAVRINSLLTTECRRFGRKKTADEIIREARDAWNPRGPLLDVYRRETRRVAGAFRQARAVTFPAGETLQVRPVPEFMRHLFPTAAYTSPGPFEKRQRGIFWVNDLSLAQTDESARRAERAQHFGLSLTCAHEAYPGHHLQFVTANRHPRRWRRLFAHAVFYEGWTLWCEQMMVDLRIDRSPWLRIQQLHDALWRAHRILVDLRLQSRRYSHEQAVRHMQRHLGFTRARAVADVNWYTASPGVPMSYWLGRLENQRLHQRLVTGRGWTLRRFNDWLLSFGTLPQAWIEKYGLD